MSRTTLIITLLLAIAMAGFTTGCVSPLDADAPRVETPLTPAPKVDPISITADFEFGGSDYAFVGPPTIKIDSTVSPMFFWMEFEMAHTGTPSTGEVEAFRVKVDSMPANGFADPLVDGEVVMFADIGAGRQDFPCARTGNTATLWISEFVREEGQPRKVEIRLLLVFNEDRTFFPAYPEHEVFGTIELEI